MRVQFDLDRVECYTTWLPWWYDTACCRPLGLHKRRALRSDHDRSTAEPVKRRLFQDSTVGLSCSPCRVGTAHVSTTKNASIRTNCRAEHAPVQVQVPHSTRRGLTHSARTVYPASILPSWRVCMLMMWAALSLLLVHLPGSTAAASSEPAGQTASSGVYGKSSSVRLVDHTVRVVHAISRTSSSPPSTAGTPAPPSAGHTAVAAELRLWFNQPLFLSQLATGDGAARVTAPSLVSAQLPVIISNFTRWSPAQRAALNGTMDAGAVHILLF